MSLQPIRQPVVAGQFYEASAEALTRQIEECYTSSRGPGSLPEINPDGPREIIGMLCPHAGYPFSGAPAAYCYHKLAADGLPDVVVIIGPSHRNPQPAIQTSGAWRTPLGDAAIDQETATDIAAGLSGFADDPAAFSSEHSLEVQVPFVQHLSEDIRIVPIMMVGQGQGEVKRVADAVKQGVSDRDAVIIASSDMTHFQRAETARKQDMLLIDEMKDLDPEGLLRERMTHDISMCGAGPAAVMLHVALSLGASSAELLAYAHSGEVHPSPEVVGYASMVVR